MPSFPNTQSPDSEKPKRSLESLQLYQIYRKTKYLSIKHESYFQTYTELFEKYRGKDIVFVEIGILNGGSLFMWRDFFGEKARIIGIDLNPESMKWKEYGFEIYTGNQDDPDFWEAFFKEAGYADIILDDGGHTNRQQIITTANCIKNINNGGMLVVEDTHASYIKKFGNPSKYSFINFAKHLVDSINSRSFTINRAKNDYWEYIHSIAFYESIVAFKIDRNNCFISNPTTNEGESFNAKDYRFRTSTKEYIFRKLSGQRIWSRIPVVKQLRDFFLWIIINRQTSKYFK
jgi:hypothetical protein